MAALTLRTFLHTSRPRSDEAVCTSCQTVNLKAVMMDASDRAPLLGLVCPPCDDELTVEEHTEIHEHCRCDTCDTYRARSEARSLARFAESAGGLNHTLVSVLGLTVRLEGE